MTNDVKKQKIISDLIFKSMHSKIDDWSYEKERRHIIHVNNIGTQCLDTGIYKKYYDVNKIKSIIFGYKSDDKLINYVKSKMPSSVLLKKMSLENNMLIPTNLP